MQDRIFYTSCLGFILGVLAHSFFGVNIYLALFLALILLSFIFVFSWLIQSKKALLLSVFLFAICLGLIRFGFTIYDEPKVFENYTNQKVSFEALVVDEPDIREKNQKLTVKVGDNNEETKLLITTDFSTRFKYGDMIQFSGKLEKPENFITDQGRDFDYINYLKKDGIYYLVSNPKIEILSRGEGNIIKRGLFYVKDLFVAKINRVIPDPESLLVGGLILGEKSAFNEKLRQNFVDTGTIHMVALSGYNVTIIAEWIMKLFSIFPHNIGIIAGIFSILLFVLMTGASSTAIRAGVMASLALFARMVNRNYDVSRALVLAGVFMILLNPYILVFDVSFQLSFIATVAVIYFAPRIEKYFHWVTKSYGMRDIFSVTTAVYIFVLPFILYKMGNLSLVALPANVLILPLIPATMIFGFLTGILGMVWHVLSVPFGYVSYLLLHYELGVVNILAEIPYAAISIPNFPLIFVLAIYGYFIYRLFGRSIKSLFESF